MIPSKDFLQLRIIRRAINKATDVDRSGNFLLRERLQRVLPRLSVVHA